MTYEMYSRGDSMSNKWDKRFLELAKHISDWSKDPQLKLAV